ncbi:MAG TPA: RDD family protein [Pyrinomonadaceae bacterium]|nr:RDD family protein [Pyrinomonadaceae bacterium]
MENQSALQCADCLAVYDGPETDCPVCQTAAEADGSRQLSSDAEESDMNISTRQEQTAPPPAASAATAPPARDAASTLIEFPVAGRGPRPQWRKELSERVREIQQRKALEAAREAGEVVTSASVSMPTEADGAATAPQLGLVPTPETPEVNPIVARALEKIERARRASAMTTTARPAARNGATHAAAAARVAEERRATAEPATPPARNEAAAPPRESAEAATAVVVEAQPAEETAEPSRTHNLVVVPPPAPPPTETDAAINEALNRPRPRRHIPEVADDALLLRREAEYTPAVPDPASSLSERAPAARRFVAAVIDLLVVAFASSPFAAVIELTSGDWQDYRVAGCLAGIVLTIMFIYQTVSVAFSGRTWGMRLTSLRAADARTGLIPTAGQCARRALFYMLSLATLGLGLLLALFDREGRAAHDHLSRTVVVTE